MRFWLRQLLMLVLLVTLPVGVALWLDTETVAAQLREAGAREVKRAAAGVKAQVELAVKAHLDDAMGVAHSAEVDRWLTELGLPRGRGEAARAAAETELSRVRPPRGFAWLVDGEGAVQVGEASSQDETLRRVGHHPLLLDAFEGMAADQPWRVDVELLWAAAAPVVVDGAARGAVVIGFPLDREFAAEVAGRIGVELSLVRPGRDPVGTLPPQQLSELVAAGFGTSPVSAGRLDEPIPSVLPGFPLFVGPEGAGLAFTSVALDVPGTEAQWMVTVPSGPPLATLGERQLNLLAAGVALAMLLILFALVEHRTYEAPLAQISNHLSEIQLGRGELELSERKVSAPFRRLVRLVNMTVQKLPSRGLPTLSAVPARAAATTRPEVPAPSVAPRREPSPSLDLSPPAPLDDDIARAIASLQPPEPPESAGKPSESRKSASAVRGAPFGSLLPPEMDDPFHEVSQFTARPAKAPEPDVPVRGGGSLDLGQAAGIDPDGPKKPAGADATVVAPVAEDLLARSARDDLTVPQTETHGKAEMTVIASVDPKLLSQTLGLSSEDLGTELDAADQSHFATVYDEYVALRKRCGEPTHDLVFERFRNKLAKNRAKLIEKYNCQTVRFQVYEKEGKAALKATPVRLG